MVQEWPHLNIGDKVGKTIKMDHRTGIALRMFSHMGIFDNKQTIMKQSTKVLNDVLTQKL